MSRPRSILSAQLRSRPLAGICLCLSLLMFALPGAAQTVIQQRDPEIDRLVKAVSAENIEKIIRKLAGFHTRHTLSTTMSDEKGIGAARRWIRSELERYAAEPRSRLQVEFDTHRIEPDGRRVTRPIDLKNVLARLPGADPNDDRVYIVSGHYDSRATGGLDSTGFAPGANDDGSGTAVAMELARVLGTSAFPATIIFVAVAGEEQGLYGSRKLAERAQTEKWHVDAMITNDIVGNSESSGTALRDNTRLRVFSEGVPAAETERRARLRQSTGGENDSPARQLARYIKEVGERYVDQIDIRLIYRRDRYLRGGDHTPFSRAGYTAVRLTEMNENFRRQHQDVRTEGGVQYGDLPEYVDYGYVAKVVRVNLAVLANLASAPAAPDSVGIVVSRLTNTTTLRWAAPAKGPRPVGYFVLMRETVSPYWERKFYIAGATEVTVAYSKDNYFFAVQSVDAEGHESLPIFPVPVR